MTDETGPDGLLILPFGTPTAARRWLARHHEDTPGLWVKIAKKGSGQQSVTYAELLDQGLCFGWIDGQKRSYDEAFFLQRFTPRRARSPWSKINCGHVERLEADGLMTPAGRVEVDAAKADGRWERAYAGQRTAQIPADLQAALDANPTAKAFFATISSVNRYAVLYRIGSVKRADTRARKIQTYVELLARGETLH
jgi:uncharacterized protein YdeI (YjbR/CyaY-like superfamily)